MQTLTLDDILKILPHRDPFLMIDRVSEWKKFDYIWAHKNVTLDEPYFQGHFPGQPIMPGVLIIESLAQAAGVLAYLSEEKKPEDYLFYLASLNNAKFKKRVYPGDTLDLHIKFHMGRLNFVKVYGEAYVNKNLVCSVDILSAKGM